MTNLLKNIRSAVLTISAASLVLPQIALAGGHSGSMGAISSHVTTHTVTPAITHISTGSPTISPSGGKAISPTIHNNSNSSVFNGSASSAGKQTKTGASSINLKGSESAANVLSPPHSQNIMDLPYDMSDPFGSTARDPLGVLNEAITNDANGPGAPTQAQQLQQQNSLSNGTTGQYGDGGTLPIPNQSGWQGQLQLTATAVSPSSSNGTPSGTTKPTKSGPITQTHVNTSQFAKTTEAGKTTISSVGVSDSAKNAKLAGSTDGTSPGNNPSNPNPAPTPTPKPTHHPSGPIFGGISIGGDSGSSNSGSSDNSTANTVATDSTAAPVAPAAVAATGIDLVLEDVRLASPATMVAGPAYTVTFRNQGTNSAGKFQVAVLAGLNGKLADDAPKAVVEVASLAAGEVKTITLRLPQSALKLTGADSKLVAFTHLFVAVDLMNTVAETDEINNTAVVERAALETLTAN